MIPSQQNGSQLAVIFFSWVGLGALNTLTAWFNSSTNVQKCLKTSKNSPTSWVELRWVVKVFRAPDPIRPNSTGWVKSNRALWSRLYAPDGGLVSSQSCSSPPSEQSSSPSHLYVRWIHFPFEHWNWSELHAAQCTQKAPLPQRDRETRYVSWKFVNCCKVVRKITFERLGVGKTYLVIGIASTEQLYLAAFPRYYHIYDTRWYIYVHAY